MIHVINNLIQNIEYKLFEERTKTRINNLFQSIRNTDRNREQLENETRILLDRILGHQFGPRFINNNPRHICLLWLTHRIALDSLGLQIVHRNECDIFIINNLLDDDLKDRVRYVYARAIRICNNNLNVTLNEFDQLLDQINPNSRFAPLANLESEYRDTIVEVPEERVPLESLRLYRETRLLRN